MISKIELTRCQLISTGKYKNGKKHAKWIEYYWQWENSLKFKGAYKDGEQHGNWVLYWNDGDIKEKGKYKNGRNVGTWTECPGGRCVKVRYQ